MTYANVQITADGEISFQERIGDGQPYDSKELIDRHDPVEVGVAVMEDMEKPDWGEDVCVLLRMSAHHVENEETHRTFHAYMEIGLSKGQAEKLREALEFVMRMATE